MANPEGSLAPPITQGAQDPLAPHDPPAPPGPQAAIKLVTL